MQKTELEEYNLVQKKKTEVRRTQPSIFLDLKLVCWSIKSNLLKMRKLNMRKCGEGEDWPAILQKEHLFTNIV